MLCQGKPQYEAVREMMDDPDYYKYALGISYAIPSAETLRQRFDIIGDSLRKDIQQANVDILREMHIEPTALDNGFVPVDIDVTPFDMTIRNPIRKAYPVPTRVLTDMHQLWPVSYTHLITIANSVNKATHFFCVFLFIENPPLLF